MPQQQLLDMGDEWVLTPPRIESELQARTYAIAALHGCPTKKLQVVKVEEHESVVISADALREVQRTPQV